jgi:hypothetical protein
MSSIAVDKDKIKKVFITKEVNKAGIYTLKLMIRGRPWVLTVDDTVI